MRKWIPTRGRLAVILAVIAVAASLGNRYEQRESAQVFSALEAQTKTELLAGAVALLTDEEDGYTVRLAVAGVLLNRLRDGRYGATLWEAAASLLDPAASSIPQTGDEGAMRAAQDALRGHMPVPGAIDCGRGEGADGDIRFGGWWFRLESNQTRG